MPREVTIVLLFIIYTCKRSVARVIALQTSICKFVRSVRKVHCIHRPFYPLFSSLIIFTFSLILPVEEYPPLSKAADGTIDSASNGRSNLCPYLGKPNICTKIKSNIYFIYGI